MLWAFARAGHQDDALRSLTVEMVTKLRAAADADSIATVVDAHAQV